MTHDCLYLDGRIRELRVMRQHDVLSEKRQALDNINTWNYIHKNIELFHQAAI